MSFPAKYAGTCIAPECLISPATKAVVVGQQIIWSRHERGKVYHAECYQAMRGINTSANTDAADDIEDMATALPTPKPIPQPTAQPTTLPSDGIAATLATAIAPYLESKLSAKMDESQVASVVDSRLAGIKPMIETAVLDAISTLQQPTRVEIHNTNTAEVRDMGIVHKQFTTLLQIAQARTPSGHRMNVELVGPSGSGKTHAAAQVAEALGLKFYYCGAVMEPWTLLGFKNAHGEYQRTAFREAYENGGVFLLDEKDASDANAILPFNSATANGHCPFPDGMVERHKDCLIMAASNTWGLGGTNEYVGRLRQDAASLDRFVQLPWEVDETLETSTAGNIEWTRRVQNVRARVRHQGIKVIISPRASYYGAALLAAGMDRAIVERIVLRKAMSDEQWNTVAA